MATHRVKSLQFLHGFGVHHAGTFLGKKNVCTNDGVKSMEYNDETKDVTIKMKDESTYIVHSSCVAICIDTSEYQSKSKRKAREYIDNQIRA